MPVDPVVLRRRLRALERYLRVLRQLRTRGRAAGTAAPETYSDAIRLVAPIIGLPLDLADRVAAAVRLRNILVHMYLEIDHGRLFDELGWIEDTEKFAACVEQWLGSLPQ